MRSNWFALAILVAGMVTACSDGEKDKGKDGDPITGSAPKIVSFDVNPSSIQTGEKVSLSWETEGATSLSITDDRGGTVEAAGATGSVELEPAQTTTWTLLAKNEHGEKSATTKVSVGTANKPTIEFSASHDRIAFGGSSKLTWSVQGADTIVLRTRDEIGDGLEPSGSIDVSPHDTTTYVLEASGPGGDASASVTIEVAPAVEYFRTDTFEPVAKGAFVKLAWKTAGADSLLLTNFDGWSVGVVEGSIAEGEVDAPVGAEGKFGLKAIRSGVETSLQVSVTVLDAPVIHSFVAAPTDFDLAEGADVTLSWNVDNATRLEVRVGDAEETVDLPVNGEGSQTFPVTATTTFTLIATNGDVKATADATVTGHDAPAIVSFVSNHEHVGAEDAFTLSWVTAHAESVTLELDGEVIAEDLAASGSLEQALLASGIYTLRAGNLLPTAATASVSMTVAIPEIGSFEASAEQGAPGDEISFTWTTVGATAVRVVDSAGEEVCAAESVDQLAAGTCEGIVPEGAEGFSLVASNGSGEAARDVEFVATTGPIIREFTVSPNPATVGATVTVSWTTEADAAGVTPVLALADGEGTSYPLGGADPLLGSVEIEFVDAGTYALTLTASTDGTDDATATRILLVVELPSVTATASPSPVGVGFPSVISWQAQHAVAVRVHALDGSGTPAGQPVFTSTNAAIATSGSTTVQPFTTTSYRVTVENAAGDTATADVEVEVEAAGIIDFSTPTPTVSAGSTVSLDWTTAGGGTVSITGMVEVPVATSPYVDISATGVLLEQDACDLDYPYDEGCVDFTVQGSGFYFPFEGIDRDSGRAYSNGFISFDLGPGILNTSEPDALPSATSSFAHLAPYWSNLLIVPDLVPGMGIYGELRNQGPDEPHVIVAWNKAFDTLLYVYEFWSEMNVEVVAYASGSFEYRYGLMWAEILQEWADGEFASIGYQDTTGTHGYMLNPGQVAVPGGLSNRSFRAERNAPAIGSLEVVVRQTTTYELCVDDGVAPICQTLTVTVN